MNSVFIYALSDPITGKIRYIGKAKNLTTRLAKHLRDRGEKNHRAVWIRSLQKTKNAPVLTTIDEVLETEWPMCEVAYIEFFRDQGCNLVNANAGGVGGHNPSEETRIKIGAANRGKKRSSETRAKISASLLGSARNLGKKHSDEAKEKNRIAHLGKKNSMCGKTYGPEVRAKMSAARMGKIPWNKGQK